MKRMLPIGGAMLVAASCCGQQRPNVIYVFPDQLRNCSLNFWNDPEYEGAQSWMADPSVTPRLREFAGESMVLSHAMSNCPISSPYRGIFLTGMYPERSGIMSNCMSERPECTLSETAVCISDVFSSNGYDCAYIGKLHANAPIPNDPANPGNYVSAEWPVWDAYTAPEDRHGFNYWYSYGTFDAHKNPHYWDTEGVKHEPREFSVKHEVDKAIGYLRNENGERDGRKPFFMCIGMNPPHSPYYSTKDCMDGDLDLYKGMTTEELFVRDNADTTMSKARAMRYYLANVTAVDREFGRLMDELRRLGLDKNTIVIFTSDHGETMCSHSATDPKNSIWTESFNVPFIIRYPGRIRHSISPMLLSTIDIMPSVLSLAGLGEQIPETAEGRDLSSALCGKPCSNLPESALYIRNINGEKDSDGMVRRFFPQARGLKTDRYTFEVAIKQDTTIKSILLFDDVEDPYQLRPLDLKANREEYDTMLDMLEFKLIEANDMWSTQGIINKVRADYEK